MCGQIRPNEAFSGKGHRRHLCKQCSRRPLAELETVRAKMDLLGYLDQKNISAKNIDRVKSLCEFDDAGIRAFAATVLEVAMIAPRKRKRAGYLHKHRPDLFLQLVDLGFFEEWMHDLDGEFPMDESNGPRYFNDDGTEFTPGLYPTPDPCISCVIHDTHDGEEEVLCNLTRADRQSDELFVCFAYQPISPSVDREEVLRGPCKQAGIEYLEECHNVDGDSDAIPF